MKFTGTALFMSAAYLATLVSAGDPIVSITSPLTNTRYKAGSEAIISWINPTVGTISQIVLARGKSNALQPLRTIATNVNAADMKYVWKIPSEIDNADDYAFELGTSPDLAFSGPFVIEGGVGDNPAGATNTTDSTPGSSSPASPGSPTGGSNGGSAATPAAPSATAGGNTNQSSPHNANASHSSAATKQQAGQAIIALGIVAAFASQFF